jgi:hypothetical protein
MQWGRKNKSARWKQRAFFVMETDCHPGRMPREGGA